MVHLLVLLLRNTYQSKPILQPNFYFLKISDRDYSNVVSQILSMIIIKKRECNTYDLLVCEAAAHLKARVLRNERNIVHLPFK